MSVEYWSKQPATVDGVTGGYASLSDLDLKDSRLFVNKIARRLAQRKVNLQFRSALDIGAGVGRVAQGLLHPLFSIIHLVEPVPALLEAARNAFGTDPNVAFFQSTAQEFTPQNHYDLIWLQWCLMYLNDDEVVNLLIRLKDSLNDGVRRSQL